jgi:hypothetical protein
VTGRTVNTGPNGQHVARAGRIRRAVTLLAAAAGGRYRMGMHCASGHPATRRPIWRRKGQHARSGGTPPPEPAASRCVPSVDLYTRTYAVPPTRGTVYVHSSRSGVISRARRSRPAAPAGRCDNTSPGDPERRFAGASARPPVPHAWRMRGDMHVALGIHLGVRLLFLATINAPSRDLHR